MKVLVAHNAYQVPGGEDSVFRSECRLLKDFGDEVETFEKNNAQLNELSFGARVKSTLSISWSDESYREFRSKIRAFKPDIVHVHNVFYLLTPSVYYACRDEGIPVVQSQHNFRLQCVNGLMFRDNEVCELCMEKNRWQGVAHKCFQGSRVKTAVLSNAIRAHWKKGTWQHLVNAYILASEFGKSKLAAAGIDADRIFVKPQLLYPDVSPGSGKERVHALYAGRLSAEKGVEVLIRAWAGIKDVPLKIIGKGPLLDKVKAKAEHLDNVEVCGFLTDEQLEDHMQRAKFLVIPSLCYENFPRIAAESTAHGIPIIASRRGSLPEVVDDHNTGLLFEPGNAEDLAEKVNAIKGDPARLAAMGAQARNRYQDLYSPSKNYERLKFIYEKAIENSGLTAH